jgi:hypothetical protein
MSEPNVRADAVDVEQIMRQIRARISEKRGADYTETELRQLASVKLERFMDPQGLRSDLIEQFRKGAPGTGPSAAAGDAAPAGPPPSLYRRLRRFVGSMVRLLSNPYRILALDNRMQTLEIRLQERDSLYYELMHNLTLEVTRLGIEVHNITMRVESLASRLDFDERRSRSLESVVQYRPQATSRPQSASPAAAESTAGPDSRPRPAAVPPAPAEGSDQGGGERRRRRRRRRRRPGQTLADSNRPQDEAGGQAVADRATGSPAGGGAFADGRADDDAGDDDGPDTSEP